RSVKLAYLDTFAGISGDMTVGALLDLGLPLDAVRDAVATLGLREVTLSVERVARSGIAATKFHVRVHGAHPDHGHHHDRGHHTHRPYADIRGLLSASALPARVRQDALAIFERLATAEG